ncbi:related to Protein PET10 [Zygosaccharomyces bailii ISA1307]|nr:related to Protein PET10 [Zygosaccharomyces bailii ISA1307]
MSTSRRSSTSSKVVVDKDITDKFARNSPTLTNLYRYPLLANSVDRIVNLPVVNLVLSWTLVAAGKTRNVILESSKTPRFAKMGYNVVSGAGKKLDELFALLVLREGLGAFLEKWHAHGNKPGFWLVYFFVDYWANLMNLLLTHFVVGSKRLEDTSGSMGESESGSKSLPHLQELRSTTIGISRDLGEKVHSDYIDKTAGYAKNKYDELFKPVADRIQTDYVDPTRAHALETYKTVSSAYESNLNKSESIPRAIISTGVDLKNITLENLKASTGELQEKVQEGEKAVADAVPAFVDRNNE